MIFTIFKFTEVIIIMISLRKMKASDINYVLEWNEGSESFLNQWSNFEYPLTEKQIEDRIASDDFNVFVILKNEEICGTIQMFKFDKVKNSARVGCYLINPQKRNIGIGQEALKQIVDFGFNTLNLDIINLGVYDFNKGAIKCYEKAGFKITKEYIAPIGWKCYDMEIYKDK